MNLVYHITDPSKKDLKRAQMIRTTLQAVQVTATLAILIINLVVLLKYGK